MKILEVKYERARSLDREKYQAEWEFRVTTDTEFPHGYDGFGGVLRRSEDGWQASGYSHTEWASPAPDRKSAIANLLPMVFEAMARGKAEEAAHEVERKRRSDFLRGLAERVKTGLRGDIEVYVSSVTDHWNVNVPMEKFEVTLRGFDLQQITLLADALENSALFPRR